MNTTGKINYIELPCQDLAASKDFFTSVFGWGFVDYGPEYTAFENAGIDGGFFLSQSCARTQQGSALVVLYSAELEATQDAVSKAGGEIVKPIFRFPGGRRFHFFCPSGNEFAVWSDHG
ncbi:VOC family protein [Halioxenophilus aromaticivorans]|uniref:VOC family protein n=1 Tax=Halioxenophilus aromaticivorans TaxID=1306992 RepID=A0AAV3TXF8_9ALTE